MATSVLSASNVVVDLLGQSMDCDSLLTVHAFGLDQLKLTQTHNWCASKSVQSKERKKNTKYITFGTKYF